MIKWYVNKLHVSTTDEALTADITARCATANFGVDQTEAAVNEALTAHHANQATYAAVMGHHG